LTAVGRRITIEADRRDLERAGAFSGAAAIVEDRGISARRASDASPDRGIRRASGMRRPAAASRRPLDQPGVERCPNAEAADAVSVVAPGTRHAIEYTQ